MGHGVAIKCRDCDYYEEFLLGCGMMNFLPEQLQADREILNYVYTDNEKSDISDMMTNKGFIRI